MTRIARNTTTILLTILAMVLAMAATALGTGAAVAATPPDPAKVPHYFGPWPNWANSPLTLNKASVTFNGTGTGAAAVAQVDPASADGISAIDITSPGQGYDASTTVTIAGGTTAATATATVSTSDVVTGFTNVVPGSGYTAFKVDLTGGVDLGVVGNRQQPRSAPAAWMPWTSPTPGPATRCRPSTSTTPTTPTAPRPPGTSSASRATPTARTPPTPPSRSPRRRRRARLRLHDSAGR